MRRKIRIWIAAALILISGISLAASGVNASMNIAEDIDLNRSSTITVQYDVSEIEFELYKVFDVNPDSSLIVSEKFESLKDQVDFSKTATESESAELAATLDEYAQLDDYKPDYKATVSEDGTALFPDVKPGVYLLKSETHVYSKRNYITQPVLFYAPKENLVDLKWDYSFTLIPKAESKPALRDPLKVVKVWNDRDDRKKIRPKEITITLNLDGKFYTEVVLSEENNWTYTWDDIPVETGYQIVEKDVPAGYTVSYKETGNEISSVHTITNTLKEEPGPRPPRKPNTGSSSNWTMWLSMAGLSSLCLGLFIGKRKKAE